MYLWGKAPSDIFFINEKQRREIKETKDVCRRNVEKKLIHFPDGKCRNHISVFVVKLKQVQQILT